MGEWFWKTVSPSQQQGPAQKYLDHNLASFSDDKLRYANVCRLNNYILGGGQNEGLDTHKVSTAQSDFISNRLPIGKRFHPDAGIFLHKRHISDAVERMKNTKDGSGSIYGHIFYTAGLLKIQPSAIMATLFSENSKLERHNASENISSKVRKNFDRGLFQVSDATRISMNQPGFINDFSRAMTEKDGAFPRLCELAGFFGIKAQDYSGAYDLAKALIREVTELKGGLSYLQGTNGKASASSEDLVGTKKVYQIKYNLAASAIYFATNLYEYGGNYQLASFSYKRGRTTTNNYLGNFKKGDKKQVSRDNEAADYSHKFWSYKSAFDAYLSPATTSKEFKDDVALFYDHKRKS